MTRLVLRIKNDNLHVLFDRFDLRLCLVFSSSFSGDLGAFPVSAVPSVVTSGWRESMLIELWGAGAPRWIWSVRKSVDEFKEKSHRQRHTPLLERHRPTDRRSVRVLRLPLYHFSSGVRNYSTRWKVIFIPIQRETRPYFYLRLISILIKVKKAHQKLIKQFIKSMVIGRIRVLIEK